VSSSSALEAIAQRSLPAGEALDAILAAARSIGELPDEAIEVSLDLVELILSIIGLIPGAGAAADAGSGVVAFAREDYLGTALAGAAILPMVGSAAGVARAPQKLRQVEAKLAALSLPLQKILLDTLTSIGTILSEWASTPIGSLFARMKGVFNDAAERLRLFAKRKEPTKPSQPAAAPTSPDVNTPAAPPTPDRPPGRPAGEPPSSSSRKTLLPTSNGKWDGPKGESGWISDKPEILAITKGEPIPYKNQRPDFSEWVVEEIEFEPGELTGDHGKDRTSALAKLVAAGRFKSRDEAKQWLLNENLAIHHETTTKMQLIPKPLNDLKHTGSASDLRNQK
jgi:hypothetical protein